jgi:hypothetical protein
MKQRTESKNKKAGQQAGRIYSFDVFIIDGPMSEEFVERNPVILRTIEIRGDQTLEDFHHAIFDAFDREDEHMYEFQLGGKGPNDPEAKKYIVPTQLDDFLESSPPAGYVADTKIDSLSLKVDDIIGYWFDFGDDWWHQVNVVSIEDKIPEGKYPKVVKREGQSPPQYEED